MASSDRFPYKTAVVLDQDLLDDCADNLTTNLEMTCDIVAPDDTVIRASDRNKYVGSTFYEALLTVPPIIRTIGEWLTGTLEFARVKLSLSNVDERFNKYLPGGAQYGTFVGRSVTVKLGLRDVASTYKTLFKGTVTPEGGAGRDVKAINLIARDDFDRFNEMMPTELFTVDEFPNIQDRVAGKAKPVIYGDYTTALGDVPARVPAFPVNGADPDVVLDGGPRNNVQLVISVNANRSFDNTNVWVRRGEFYYAIASSNLTNVSADNNAFEIEQGGTLTDINGVVQTDPFYFEASDEFFVRVTGKDLGAYSDNFVWIARDILITYGNAVSGDFHANWATYRDKASPVESAIATQKCREHRQEAISALSLALSMLEQVRLEAFVDRDQKIKINSLHFEDFQASPAFNVKNWDIVKGSFLPNIDNNNNFTRVKGFFSRMPDTNDNEFETPFFRNQASIDDSNRTVTKGLVYPCHYEAQSVYYNAQETLKLASAWFEVIACELTWRAVLLDIGDFVKLNVKIGSAQYTDVPCLIRDVGYDPAGKVYVKLWALQTVSFPGYSPVTGSVGGYDATITQE